MQPMQHNAALVITKALRSSKKKLYHELDLESLQQR